jgi:thymidine phosphorylase
VRELTIELGARILVATQHATGLPEARTILQGHLDSGRAWERFGQMIAMQGGDLAAARPLGRRHPWHAPRSGTIIKIDGQRIGQAIIAMGGGRTMAGESIDHSVGIQFQRRLGDAVTAGEVVLELFCDNGLRLQEATRLIASAVTLGHSVPKQPILWRDYLEADASENVPWEPSLDRLN